MTRRIKLEDMQHNSKNLENKKINNKKNLLCI